MSYRDDLSALSARHAALEHEVAQKTRELEQASRMLDEATAKSRLPVLDNIRIASPCSADWAKMAGDDRVRHCGDCDKHVYNLTEMTRDEAEALILAKEGRLCVRYFQRTDGTILLKDCTIGAQRRRRRRWVAAGAAALLAGGAAVGYDAVEEAVDVEATAHEGRYRGVVGMMERPEIGPPTMAMPDAGMPVKPDTIGQARAEGLAPTEPAREIAGKVAK